MALKKGDKIPTFVSVDQNGNQFDIASLLGNKPLVIYFYPKNFTPGCTKEACSFRDRYEDFKDLGAEVIGISGDTSNSHARFVSKYNLPFIMLEDTAGRIKKLFEVKGDLMGLIPGRETFVIDKKGKLILRYDSMNATSHIPKALNALRKELDEN